METKKLFDISGKVAIVTGASRGLGRAMAGGFLDAGATVVGASRSPWDIPRSDKALYVKTDVGEPGDVESLVSTVMGEFGRIDILVNNAGIDAPMPAVETLLETWDRILNVNLRGMFLLCREAGKIMIGQGGGKIINIASILGLIGCPDAVSYTASKGAVIQMTRTLACEWAKFNINVNCIAPGFFITDMVRETVNNPGLMRLSHEKVPRGRVGNPEEIVGTALFLASAASDYVNGAVIVVDGGEMAASGYTEAIMDYYDKGEGGKR